jgi:DNA-binding NtrC family response regulator
MKATEFINLLLIEDEAYDVRRVRNTLQPFDKRIRILDVVSDGREAVELMEKNSSKYDVVIMDFQIPGPLRGENLIRKIKEIDQMLQIIVVTKMTINVTDFDFANTLLEAGAVWYCTKYPGDIDQYIYQPTDFILSIFNAYERKKLLKERLRSDRRLQKNIQNILEQKRIIGQSAEIQTLHQHIQKFAATDVNVMIQGASGTGKELVATNIHYLSKRKYENFVPINCGSLPSNLIESELFGYEKGAFTGASSRKPGLFEVANRGTIFLDEITEIPLSAQSKLLRVIQEGEIDKIGRTEKLRVDVRIIAATNKNLEQEVHEKRFREDLYYRLNVGSITVPPLTKRREDIPLLVEHFVRQFSADMNRELPQFDEQAMELLSHYDWPGNVRELQNVVQRLLFFGDRIISAQQIKIALGISADRPSASGMKNDGLWNRDQILPWREMERKLQENYFRFVRESVESDAEAARLLGLAPPNYYRMCKRLGLK